MEVRGGGLWWLKWWLSGEEEVVRVVEFVMVVDELVMVVEVVVKGC
jgi:hypothetical protein